MAEGNGKHETEIDKRENHAGGRKPDPDAIRMFVGQIPRQWTEKELNELFEEFGEVYQLIILKEKGTGANRGCCFVTYCTRRSALEAQIALHSVKILPGMKHPIQMKPADNDPTKNAEERKLFIGMVSRKHSEDDVRKLFSSYGTIEECIILRDTVGKSKGCAFVQFSTRQSCINAIRGLNRSQVMEGCTGPITVKFAETAKQKEMKKMMNQQMPSRSQFPFGGNSNTQGNFDSSNSNNYFGNQQPSSGNMQQSFGSNQPQNTGANSLQQQLTLMALTAAAGQSQPANPLMAALQSNVPSMPNLSGINNLSPQVLQALALLLQPNQPQQAIFNAVSTIVAALISANNSSNSMPNANTGAFNTNFSANDSMGMFGGSNSGGNQLANLFAALQQSQQQSVPPPPLPPQTQQMSNFSDGNAMAQGGSNTSTGNDNTVDSFTQAFLQGVNQYAQSQAGNQFASNNSVNST